MSAPLSGDGGKTPRLGTIFAGALAPVKTGFAAAPRVRPLAA